MAMRPFKKSKTGHEDGERVESGSASSLLLEPSSREGTEPVSARQSPPDITSESPPPPKAFDLEDGDNEQTTESSNTAVTEPPTVENEEKQGEEGSSSEDGEESGSEMGLNEAQNEILEELEDCLIGDNSEEEKGPKVSLDRDTVSYLRSELFSKGPMRFLQEYVLMDSPYKVTDILCAFGFALPLKVVEKYDQEDFKTFLPVAIKHFASARKRLPYPHTIEEFNEVINRANKILVLTGAGISTSLGIPDFRSSTGLYAQLADCGLSDPQEVFDIHIFREDPSIFYRIAKEVLPGDKNMYTPTHAFIKMLYDRGKLLRNYTQNIDNLEANAGVPPEYLVQCHGSFATATCQTCRHRVDGASIFDEIRAQKIALCPLCQKSKQEQKPSKKSKKNDSDEDDEDPFEDASQGVLKPDITFFGEALPSRFDDLLLGPDGDAAKCDLVICIGTSLKVAPVSEIVRVVDRETPQVYINKTPINHNEFDITFLGNCDDVIEWMAEQLSWPFDHKMNKRSLGQFSKLSFPNGLIEFQENQATYRFNYDNN
jgi:NAD-dependent histone deacetylase SIR2